MACIGMEKRSRSFAQYYANKPGKMKSANFHEPGAQKRAYGQKHAFHGSKTSTLEERPQAERKHLFTCP